MSEWNFRLAEPADAEAFSKWAAENQQIDEKDLQAGMGKNNPTVLTFVVEKDGKPILFAPLHLAAVLDYIGMNPDSRASEKVQGLNVLKDGVAAFMVQFGVREIQTLTKPEYGVAKWALANGFEQDVRETLRLNLNKEMQEA